MSPSKGKKILIAQRRNCRNPPHLTIYKLQLTSVNYSLERITDVVLGGSIYIFSIIYLASLYLGFILERASCCHGRIAMGEQDHLITLLGVTVCLHGFNSMRHLAWDMAKGFKMVTVYRTGYAAADMPQRQALQSSFYSRKMEPQHRSTRKNKVGGSLGRSTFLV